MAGEFVDGVRATTQLGLTSCSVVLNPKSWYYKQLRETWTRIYEDNFWAEDALFLERNSRDFVSRISRINANAEAICDVLREHPRGRSSPVGHANVDEISVKCDG